MIYDLIIIGAGPAGVSAAIYAARQKLNLLVISKDMGGQLTKKAVDIENYPGFEKISGIDLAEIFSKQLKANGLDILEEEVVGIKKENSKFFIKTSADKNYETLSVIITSGAKPKTLNVPGEEEFSGKGVSYCALCDGPVFRDKTVAVVGGGNNGFETALFLSNYVKKIYILEYSDHIRADRENQELVAKKKHIEVIRNAGVLRIEGEKMVKSLTYKDNISGKEMQIDVDGVFVEIGYAPATGFLNGLVELNDRNEVIFDLATLATKTQGLFSAGDCNKSKYKQIVIAAGEGAKAALAAYEYLQKQK